MSTPMRLIRSTCCACTANGHADAEPTIALMKSRRRIGYPNAFQLKPSEQEIATGEIGLCDAKS
jgi:hypothetical protein